LDPTQTVTTPHTAADIRPIIIGNWKMNGLKSATGVALAVRDGLGTTPGAADVIICPPATLLMVLAEVLKGSLVKVGAQDCHAATAGAHTGDISADMVRDSGATAVILGHSERRSAHGERDVDVKAKVAAAHRAGLTAIVCVGETAGERAAGLTGMVVARQLAGSLPADVTPANTIIAYEPVWAIGTGLTATATDVAAVHAQIAAAVVPGMRILYGGSVKPANARELMGLPNVHGALVGGASLTATDFLGILAAYAPAVA
jgi:triosephosphate isomerase (TIM)